MQEKVEYIYHWNRIIGAAAVLLALIGLVAWGLFRWLATPPGPDQVSIAPDVPVAESVNAPPIETPNQSTLEPEPPLEPTANEPPVPTGTAETLIITDAGSGRPVLSAEQYPGTAETEQATATMKSSTITDPAEVKNSSPDMLSGQPPESVIDTGDQATRPNDSIATTTVVAKRATTPVTAANSSAVKANEEDAPSPTASRIGTPRKAEPVTPKRGPLSLKNIAKHSPLVKRFVLAKSVVNREPRGAIDDITFDKQGVGAVYCFSEVSGHEHSTLDYVWLRNDQVVARVDVAVKGERWRSYSSKLLNRRLQGNWRVELRGKNNELLASADFVL